MTSFTSDVMLAVSGSLAASILIKVTVTTALALAGARLARKSRAALRHVLLAAAFAMLLVLPIASIAAPPVRIAVPVAARAGTVPFAAGAIGEVNAPASPAGPGIGAQSTMPQRSWPPASALVLAGWMLGATLFVSPVGVGLWQVRRLRRSGRAWAQGQSIVDRLAVDVETHRRVEVLVHASVSGPMTCGIVHPVIVLPTDARTWLEEDLSRAILHELEHVRRGDWATQCAARAVCAVYWFHPLVWIAWRQLSLDAERACDDAVLRRAEATAYADQLVVLAQRLSADSQAQLAMANRHDLATRVGAVLDSRQRRGRAGTGWIALAAAVSALLVTAISPLRVVPAAAALASPAQPVPKFEVASVKPCKLADLPPGERGAGPRGPSVSPGRLHLECAPLVGANGLIRQAYGVFSSGRYNAYLQPSAVPVEGGPAWARSERYTIDAKAEGAPSLEMMRGPMLQALLEDRFQLKVRRETRDVRVYELTVAKGGARLRPFDGRCKPVDFTKGDIPAQLEAEGSCPIALRNTRVDAPGQTVGDFITFVLTLLDRPVIDKTGLTGRFDIHLDLPPDENAGALDETSTLAAALQQQLGLKLVPAKGQGEYLVIDRLERPGDRR
jgi:uncharacterized protein (TIGR03435 family)